MPQVTGLSFGISRRCRGPTKPSSRLQGTQVGPKLDDAGTAGTGILFFEQVRGCGWDRHRMTATRGKRGGDAGWHDQKAHLTGAIVAHPIAPHDFVGVGFANI